MEGEGDAEEVGLGFEHLDLELLAHLQLRATLVGRVHQAVHVADVDVRTSPTRKPAISERRRAG